ncbi:MAG: AAA family ATPase, partial [Tepidiformaceae bacterium]
GQKRADHYPALRGGAHGGRLVLVDDRGAEWTVTRTESPKASVLEISGPGGRMEHPETTLLTLRGHASKPVYESVFAFSLNELQSVKSLDDKDVSSQIYSAGMGAAKLPGAIKRIEADQEKLFKSGGSVQTIAGLLAGISTKNDELRLLSCGAERYGELTEQLAVLRQRVEADTCALRDMEKSRRRMERIHAAWPDFVALRGAESRLALLPDYPAFPENTVARLEKLDEALEHARKELERAAEAHARAKANARLPLPNERLLALGEQIERLQEERANFSQLVAQMPARIQQREEAGREFGAALDAVGPDWDEARLKSFDAGVQAHGLVDNWKVQLDTAGRVLDEAAHESQAAVRAFAEAAALEREQREEFERIAVPALDGDAIERRRRTIQAARTRLNEWLLARQRHADDRETAVALAAETVPVPAATATPGKVLPIILIAGGILLAAMGLGTGGAAALGGPLGGVALIGGGLWLRWRRSGGAAGPAVRSTVAVAAERRAESARLAEHEARARLDEQLVELGVTEPSPDELDILETQARAAGASWEQWVQARERTETRAAELARLRDRRDKTATAAESAAKRRELEREQWRAWLAERHLQPELLPATMDAVFARVETARAKLEAVAVVQRRVESMQADIDTYRRQVMAIGGPLEMPLPAANADLLAFADGLVRRHKEAEAQARELGAAQDAEAQTAKVVAERGIDSEASRAAIAAFVRLGGTEDAEEFRRRARTCDERREEQGKVRAARERLRALAGAGEGFERLMATLCATDIEALEQDLAAGALKYEELGESQRLLLIERGKLEHEVESLASDERASMLRAERAELQEQLREQAERWAVATTALTVLREARGKFERERQPGVIRHAETFFAGITEGRY